MSVDKKEQSRKLSPAEERRLALFEETCRQMEEKGYQRKELTIGIVKANVFAVLLSVPISALCVWLFLLKNKSLEFLRLSGVELVIYMVCYLLLIAVHELLHGVTWAIFAEGHFSSIEFGFMKEYLTPYCTCRDPLKKGQYILGALMPLLVLGILPAALGILLPGGLLFWIGILMTLSAGGDILIVIQILRYRSPAAEKLFFDHPTQAGVVVYER